MRALSPSGADPNVFARDLFDGLASRYDVLAEVLSFGQNMRWRKAMVDVVAGMSPPPRRVLDVATGTAGVAVMLTERTDAAVVGADLTEPMLRRGRQRITRLGKGDLISLVIARGEQLPFPDGTFDALTFTYLLRYVADPAQTLSELARVVRPGGYVANLEFGVPERLVFRLGWLAYTRTVLPLAGLLTGGREWFAVGRFLGPSISGFYEQYPVWWLQDAWRAAGLTGVTSKPMSFGGGLITCGRKSDG